MNSNWWLWNFEIWWNYMNSTALGYCLTFSVPTLASYIYSASYVCTYIHSYVYCTKAIIKRTYGKILCLVLRTIHKLHACDIQSYTFYRFDVDWWFILLVFEWYKCGLFLIYVSWDFFVHVCCLISHVTLDKHPV